MHRHFLKTSFSFFILEVICRVVYVTPGISGWREIKSAELPCSRQAKIRSAANIKISL